MPQRVFVTGLGIISAIGSNVKEVMDSLKEMRTGVGPLTRIDSIYKDDIPVGEIRASNRELLEEVSPSAGAYYSRTALLGLIAARQAFAQARFSDSGNLRTGLISGTTTGGMDRSEHFYQAYLKDNHKGRIRDIIGHDCGDSTERIADNLGIKDFLSTINTACSSSANSIMLATRMIRQGKLDRAVAGGSDALTLFTLNGFNSLMILDKQPCRPFDENRNGLNLGEGAGFLVLESEASVIRENKPVLCEIKGYGNSCDAYHQTASSPEGHGAFLAMKKALETSHLAAEDISYINAHGTGTKNNDLSEGNALEKLFAGKVPPCSSTKSYTGHTLGASGAIEAVLSVLALQYGWIYPNLNFSQKMNELSFTPVTGFSAGLPLRHVMSNSFGFGGNNSSLIFSKC